MQAIWNALVHTPWWVYVLLIYLIKVGIRASKTNVVSIIKLSIIPIIFTVMSVHTLVSAFPISIFTVSVWAATLLLGCILGFWQIFRLNIQVDKQHYLIRVPGTWTTLVIILIIFASKYYFGYELAVDPNLATQNWFEISLLLVSGVCTGLFIGRLICYVYQMFTQISIPLEEKQN